MRKGALVFIICAVMCMAACGRDKRIYDLKVPDSLKETQSDYSEDNISVIGDVMYAPISGTTVTASGMRKFSVQEFVDLRTGVIYMAYSTSTTSSSISVTPVYNTDGTLKVYEELDELRAICDYK